MHVSEIWIYPVKGCAGIPVREWPLDDFGLRYDRRWMAVTEGGAFVTQRDRPRIGQLRVTLEDTALVLHSASAGELKLPLETEGPAVRARVWNDDVAAVDAGDEAAAFLTAHLESPARLVHMAPESVRQVDLTYALPGDRVSFADAYPLLIISEASLDELNGRLADEVTMLRFRPNLVVAGAPHGHAEDGWARIRVGATEMELVKPCARCVVTTLDPATGVGGREPLRTLATYRTWSRLIYFGQNAVHRGRGVLRVGDGVEVLESRSPEPPLM